MIQIHQNLFRRERQIEGRRAVGVCFYCVADSKIRTDAVHQRWFADGFGIEDGEVFTLRLERQNRNLFWHGIDVRHLVC